MAVMFSSSAAVRNHQDLKPHAGNSQVLLRIRAWLRVLRSPALLTALAAGMTACGSSDSDFNGLRAAAQPFEGVYRVTTHTLNERGCDTEGKSLLAEQDQYVYGRIDNLFSVDFLQFNSCPSEAECRTAMAEKDPALFSQADYAFVFTRRTSDGFDGEVTSSGFSGQDGTCEEGQFSKHSLVSESAGHVRLELRTTNAPPYPQSDEACTTDGARAAADRVPCSTYEVVTAEMLPPP